MQVQGPNTEKEALSMFFFGLTRKFITLGITVALLVGGWALYQRYFNDAPHLAAMQTDYYQVIRPENQAIKRNLTKLEQLQNRDIRKYPAIPAEIKAIVTALKQSISHCWSALRDYLKNAGIVGEDKVSQAKPKLPWINVVGCAASFDDIKSFT